MKKYQNMTKAELIEIIAEKKQNNSKNKRGNVLFKKMV